MQQASPQAYLIIQLGHRWTDVLRLQPSQSVFIGRSSDNQIVVHDERVSRKHAEILPESGGWCVRDLGSRNGTQVNDQTIQARRPLNDGETIGVGGCRITFSYSLTGGFSASRRMSQDSGKSLGGEHTVELSAPPTIVNRRSHSQWSSDVGGLPGEIAARSIRAAKPTATGDRQSGNVSTSSRWNFFYRLVFDLVACNSPEQAAQVALERLLEQLGVASGGVVTIEAFEQIATLPPEATDTVVSSDARLTLPPMAVLATRQPDGRSYHRVSDFLVATAISDRQAVLARNVMDDSKLSLEHQSARRDIVSVICAPLRLREAGGERVIGLLHVYSSGEERMLNESDLDLTVGVADNLAIALSRHQDNERLSRSLADSRRRIDLLEEQLEISSDLVGRSKALQKVRKEIQRAAPTAATVLIRGESGAGKELVARAIHNASSRSGGPLVCLNCAALAPTLLESELFGHEKGAFTGATDRKLGKFEAADGGTLLLDEIGEMPHELQAKLLRVLEGHTFERLGGHKPIKTNVRVIAATNRDLEAAVKAKEFRADLYYRLRVIEISVPPLRERQDDVPLLVEHFLDQLRLHAGRRLTGIEPEALECLSRHNWPGNVRELRNVIERAVVLGNSSTIRVEDLNLSTLGTVPVGDQQSATGMAAFQPISLLDLEKAHILATLKHVGGNKSRASQILGIERSTLDRKLKRYDL